MNALQKAYLQKEQKLNEIINSKKKVLKSVRILSVI